MTPALLKRVGVEKRSLLLPLAVAVVANIAVYALVVLPLGVQSAGAAERAEAASFALRAAEREKAAADALVAGKARADEELTTFYQKVLPADLTAARRMTYASLPALARRTNVRYEERRFDIEEVEKDARLEHLRIRMTLQGEYESLRQFVYELESAPEFVIIDDVTLTQSDASKPLTLTISLSTYYRLRANGA
jgi:Tfp pilus assembly protein PilO